MSSANLTPSSSTFSSESLIKILHKLRTFNQSCHFSPINFIKRAEAHHCIYCVLKNMTASPILHFSISKNGSNSGTHMTRFCIKRLRTVPCSGNLWPLVIIMNNHLAVNPTHQIIIWPTLSMKKSIHLFINCSSWN